MCFETACSETSNGAASCVTVAAPSLSAARIPRRVGSESAANVASSVERFSTTWLNIARYRRAVFTAFHRGGSGPPMVCLHGFSDTWRIWELVLPALERRHDVLAPTLAGHAGGPRFAGPLADAVERAMDDAGFATAHLVGNSLGGHVALQLAARGRAET